MVASEKCYHTAIGLGAVDQVIAVLGAVLRESGDRQIKIGSFCRITHGLWMLADLACSTNKELSVKVFEVLYDAANVANVEESLKRIGTLLALAKLAQKIIQYSIRTAKKGRVKVRKLDGL